MDNVYLPYIIVECYCLIFAVAVLLRLNGNVGSQQEVRELRNVILAYFGMIIFDVVSVVVENFMSGAPVSLDLFLYSVTVAMVSFGCYFWFRFIIARFYPTRRSSWKEQILFASPLAIVVILDIVSIFVPLFLVFDSATNGIQVSNLFWIQGGVNYLYLLAPTVISIYRIFKSHSHSDRREYLIYALYMVAPLTAGLLEDIFPTTPILALNIFLVIHVLFLMIQDKQIYNDALTNLNNRRNLNHFLEERLSRASAEKPVTVFMIDINGFKAINDRFGHVEGDNALRLFAGVFRDLAPKYNAFIARYGGDEFSMVLDSPSFKPEEVLAALNSSLQEAQKKNASSFNYELTLSVGYYTCTTSGMSSDVVFAKADEGLYVQKKEWHRKNDVL